MTSTLLPRYDHWPHAVRSAAMLRGALVRCGPGVRGMGWPDSPALRAAALAEWWRSGRCAVLRTAAWVWGARAQIDPMLEFSVPARRRAVKQTFEQGHRVSEHEFRCPAADHLELVGCLITSPMRTVVDLLCHVRSFDRTDQISCRLLILTAPGNRSLIAQEVSRLSRRYRARAEDRLASL